MPDVDGFEEIKKLSTKTIVGNIRDITSQFKKDKEGLDLYILGGIATGFSTGSSNYGDWVKIQGDFRCYNLLNGDKYKAPTCFVQEPVQGYLLNALSNANEVEFTVKVRVMRDDSSPVGYTYILTPVLDAEQTNRLKQVSAKMDEAFAKFAPALAAPETPAKKAASK